MKLELVRDWMTRDVVVIKPDMTLPEAHQLMMDRGIRRLPVVDKNGRLVGIVTLGDIRGAQPSRAISLSIWELNYLLSTLQISDIMNRNPLTISPEATVGDAAWLMLDNKLSGLPVVDANNRVQGIITESDLFRMVVRQEFRPLAVDF